MELIRKSIDVISNCFSVFNNMDIYVANGLNEIDTLGKYSIIVNRKSNSDYPEMHFKNGDSIEKYIDIFGIKNEMDFFFYNQISNGSIKKFEIEVVSNGNKISLIYDSSQIKELLEVGIEEVRIEPIKIQYYKKPYDK